MMLEFILYAFSILGSLSIVQAAGQNGYLGGAFYRVFTGSSLSVASTIWLQSYANIGSFTSAAANGYLGLGGFVYIFGLFAITAVWTQNLIQHKTLIR
jgi:hypothetical protein